MFISDSSFRCKFLTVKGENSNIKRKAWLFGNRSSIRLNTIDDGTEVEEDVFPQLECDSYIIGVLFPELFLGQVLITLSIGFHALYSFRSYFLGKLVFTTLSIGLPALLSFRSYFLDKASAGDAVDRLACVVGFPDFFLGPVSADDVLCHSFVFP